MRARAPLICGANNGTAGREDVARGEVEAGVVDNRQPGKVAVD